LEGLEFLMKNQSDQIFVTGHINPDTDSIAAAMGYAWLLKARDGSNAIPSRAGSVNPQTSWLLKKLDLDPPLLLTDASPRFESVTKSFDTVFPESPLSEAWELAGKTGGIAPVVTSDGIPYGLIDGFSLFNFFRQVIGNKLDNSESKIADLISYPCKDAVDVNVPKFNSSAHIRDSINRILREEYDNFFIVDENGIYKGICNQKAALNPPRLKIVMVDHNEANQSIAALDEAELLEILDHHRLGNPHTHQPIKFTVDTVGSTSTLITELTNEAGLSMPHQIAGMLLGGLLADTLILTSPTTIERDKRAAERLSRWAFVANGQLRGYSIQKFGMEILSAGAGLANKDPDEVVSTDIKSYESGGYRFSVAQAEVTDLLQLREHKDRLQNALNLYREKRGLDFSLLLVTDVVRGDSRLLVSDEAPAFINELPFPPFGDGTRDAKGIVSRKKQLLPAVLGLLE